LNPVAHDEESASTILIAKPTNVRPGTEFNLEGAAPNFRSPTTQRYQHLESNDVSPKTVAE
jgi:hypothetical protein